MKMLLLNAYGSFSIQKPVKIFFRTNIGTCITWFSRVRFYMIEICARNGHYELAVRHCYEFIKSSIQLNQTCLPEFDHVIVILVKSLIKLNSWQSLLGLHTWLTAKLNRSIDWIKTAANEARGRSVL